MLWSNKPHVGSSKKEKEEEEEEEEGEEALFKRAAIVGAHSVWFSHTVSSVVNPYQTESIGHWFSEQSNFVIRHTCY